MILEKAKISTGGMIALLYSFHVVATIFPISGMAMVAKSSAWIAALLACGVGVAVVWIWLAACPPRLDTSMPDWISRACGSFLGFVLNALYLLFFLIMCGITLRHLVELVSTAILPKTPNVVVLFLFAASAAIAARMGIEVLARSAQVYIGISAVAFLLMAGGITPFIDLENYLPVMSEGIRPVLVGAIPSIATLSMIGLGIWIGPYLRDRTALASASTWAILLSGGAILLFTFLALGLFSYRGMEDMLIPGLAVARSIRLGRIVERLDVPLLGAWLIVAFIAVAFLIYLAATQVAWVGRTSHYRPFVLPVTVIGATMAMVLVRSDAELAEWVNTGAFAPYVLFHTVVIPVIIVLARLLRRGQQDRNKSGEVGKG